MSRIPDPLFFGVKHKDTPFLCFGFHQKVERRDKMAQTISLKDNRPNHDKSHAYAADLYSVQGAVSTQVPESGCV
jgi:hypothetical protein